MSISKVIYERHEIDDVEFINYEPEYLFWPSLAYNVVVTVSKDSSMNIFEKTALMLMSHSLYDIKRLSKQMCVGEGFIKLLLNRLRDNGYLKGFELTDAGKELLGQSENAHEDCVSGYVLQDCLSGQFHPIILPKISKRQGDLSEDRGIISFRPSPRSKPIEGKIVSSNFAQDRKLTSSDVIHIIKQAARLSVFNQQDDEDKKNFILDQGKVRVSPDKPERLYICTRIDVGKYNNIYITDAFRNAESQILISNLNNSLLDKTISDIKGRYLNQEVVGSPSASSSFMDKYNELCYLLRSPFSSQNNEVKAMKRNEEAIMEEGLENLYTALEMAFRKMLSNYNCEDQIRALSQFYPNKIQEMFESLAKSAGFSFKWHKDLPENLHKGFTFHKEFFLYSGNYLKTVLRGEGNLQHLVGISLALYGSKHIAPMKHLVEECPDSLCLFSYLGPFRKEFSHGAIAIQLPNKEQFEFCRNEVIKIVRILVNDADEELLIVPEGYSSDEWHNAVLLAEHELENHLGHSRFQSFPPAVKSNLRGIVLYRILNNPLEMFKKIFTSLESSLVFVLEHIDKSVIDGRAVKNKVKQLYPDLPEFFFHTNDIKLTKTLLGDKTALRQNLLCVMANSSNHEIVFDKNNRELVGKVLSMRTHNWRETLLNNATSDDVFTLGENIIVFVNLLLKEHDL